MAPVEVHAATPERWDDVADLFRRPGPRGGTPITAGCWCQFWHQRGKDYTAGFDGGNRRRLEEQIRSGGEPGLLAYDDERAVGWCRIGPREMFERLEASRTLARTDDVPVWSLVCFYVHPTAKRRGVATALLDAAVVHASANGATTVEAYAARPGHPNIDAYTGYLRMFLAAGFEPVGSGGRRTIVRRELTPTGASPGSRT
jgi:GNAT superfamily N-acetyltransferase